jgi:hypothetical protein
LQKERDAGLVRPITVRGHQLPADKVNETLGTPRSRKSRLGERINRIRLPSVTGRITSV